MEERRRRKGGRMRAAVLPPPRRGVKLPGTYENGWNRHFVVAVRLTWTKIGLLIKNCLFLGTMQSSIGNCWQSPFFCFYWMQFIHFFAHWKCTIVRQIFTYMLFCLKSWPVWFIFVIFTFFSLLLHYAFKGSFVYPDFPIRIVSFYIS